MFSFFNSASNRASNARCAAADSAPNPVKDFSSSNAGAACAESIEQSRTTTTSGRKRRRRIKLNLRRKFKRDVKARPSDFITAIPPYQDEPAPPHARRAGRNRRLSGGFDIYDSYLSM